MADVNNPVSVLYTEVATGRPVAVSEDKPLPVAMGDNGGAVLTTQPNGWSFRNITTATTTQVKTGAGVLHSVTVNSKGTIASTVTLYDNTAASGTKIGVIDSLNLTGTFTFDAAFATGLCVVTTGTVAPDITVSYR